MVTRGPLAHLLRNRFYIGDVPFKGEILKGEQPAILEISSVFDLVMWWAAEDRAVSRARWALWLCRAELLSADEPFAAIIFCTSDPGNVDKRTRSKWSRVLRYALKYKSHSEPLERFIKRNRGINACAGRLAKC